MIYIYFSICMPMLSLDTLALNLRNSLETLFSCGTPLSQTGAVKVVRVLSTKLTPSLTPSTMRMIVKQSRPQSVGSYQVNE